MRLRFLQERSSLTAAIVGLLIAISVGPTLSQSPPATSPQADQKPSATLDHFALPSRVRMELNANLDRDEKRKKIGLQTLHTFPMPSCNFDGRLCGAVNRDGTVAVAPKFQWIGPFLEGRATVRQGALYGYVDENGHLIATPQFSTAGWFFQGLVHIDIDGGSGVIDRDGQVVLWPRFGFVVPFTGDRFWATEEREIH